MPREAYYQEVGNPLRRAMLPSRPLVTALPVRSGSSKSRRRLIAHVVMAIVAADALCFVISGPIVHELLDLVRAVITCLVSLCVVVFVASRLPDWTSAVSYGIVGIVSSAAATSAIIANSRPEVLWLHAGIITGGFVWLYLRHWTERCTTSPLGRNAANILRGNWQPSLILMAVIPLLVALVACVTIPLVALLLAIAIFIAYCFTTPPGRSANPFRPGLDSLASWLTYNANHQDLPGTFKSPIGRCSTRCILTVACCFIAGTCARDAIPLPVVIPSLAVFIMPILVGRPLIHEASVFRRDSVTPASWSSLVADVRSSPNPIERESFYFGRVLADRSPLIVPRRVAKEHVHFLGDTGGGKTALGLAPFIEQAISFGDSSVIVVDLKADTNELMATMIAAADKLGKERGIDLPLKYLSTQEDLPSYAFNPQTQAFWKQFSAYHKTDLLTGATGLNYGTDFGAAFFSAANEGVVKHLLESFPDTETFKELAEQCGFILSSSTNKRELHPEMRRNGTHVHEILKRLGAFKPLNASVQDGFPQEVIDEGIDLADTFKRPQLLYFHLSSVLSPGAAPALARFVTFFLLASATKTERKVPVYLVIDEFQRMVSGNFAYMLQLARSMGVRIVLANQSMEDLKTAKSNLIPTIEANCRFRQWFSVSSSADRERLTKISGSTVEQFATVGESWNAEGKSSCSYSQSEKIVPRLDTDDIALASDHPKHSIVQITRGAGYAQYSGLPFIVESDFHIPVGEYTRRQNMPWPTGDHGTFIPTEWNRRQPAQEPTGPEITTEIVGANKDADNPFAELLNDWPADLPFESSDGQGDQTFDTDEGAR